MGIAKKQKSFVIICFFFVNNVSRAFMLCIFVICPTGYEQCLFCFPFPFQMKQVPLIDFTDTLSHLPWYNVFALMKCLRA
ncbi:hypothetical protein XELAEV_18002120mg [Xenopus laevis]|nr:hypothetical protein XELAEV_18002120mg [Xenopus laevis]